MVLDKIENCERYYSFGPLFEAGFKFLQRDDLDTLPIGRVPIIGDDCYALVKEYETRTVDQCELETHIEYYDIHYILDGFEFIAYADKSRLLPATFTRVPLTDVDLYEKEYNNQLFVEKGDFTIFFRNDAHMPHRKALVKTKVRKIIIKIRAEANEAALKEQAKV